MGKVSDSHLHFPIYGESKMSYHVRRTGRVKQKGRPRRQSLQKPNGAISSRVQKAGGQHFAIVCVDPAKHRSEWMMADYFGNLLIEPQTVEHQSVFFNAVVEMIRQKQQEHGIRDTIVVVERTHERARQIDDVIISTDRFPRVERRGTRAIRPLHRSRGNNESCC